MTLTRRHFMKGALPLVAVPAILRARNAGAQDN